jgi:hypothetical protein
MIILGVRRGSQPSLLEPLAMSCVSAAMDLGRNTACEEVKRPKK